MQETGENELKSLWLFIGATAPNVKKIFQSKKYLPECLPFKGLAPFFGVFLWK